MDSSNVLTIEEQRQVVTHLHRLTESRRIKWEPGPRDDVLGVALGKHVYTLMSKDADGLLPYQLDIYLSGKPDPMASILTRSIDSRDYDDIVADTLRDLYESAYRFTHRSESEITSLLTELDKIEKSDAPPSGPTDA